MTLLGPGHPVPWEQFNDDYDAIRDAIAAVVPGCADYNAQVARPDGFQLPHPPRDSREFPTTTGKANFAVNPLEWVPVPPAGWSCRHCAATTSTTPPSTGSTTATAA